MGIFVLILLCAWVAVLAWDFKKAVIVLPAFFPLYLLKFQVGFVPFNVIEVMVYLSFAWMAVLFLREKFSKKPMSFFNKILSGFLRKKRQIHFLLFPILIFVMGTFIGLYLSYLSGDIIRALGIFKGWIFMPILYVWIVVRVLKKPDDKKRTMNFYMFSSVVLSLWGLWQVFSGDFITVDQRASGPFDSANYLALYVAPAFVFACINLWQKMEVFFFGELESCCFVKNFLKKLAKRLKGDKVLEDSRLSVVYDVFVFGIVGFALIASRSYGGMLGVLGALFFYTVYALFFSCFKEKYGSIKRKIFVFLVMILMAITAVIAQIGTSKFDDFLAFERQSSSSVRVQTWMVSFDLIRENPFFGVGLGGFENLYGQRAKEILGVDPYEGGMLHPHNLILSTWLNAGLLGVFAILWIVFIVFKSLRLRECDFETTRFRVAVVAMFVAVLLHGIFDQPFWKNDLALVWWMIVGLVI